MSSDEEDEASEGHDHEAPCRASEDKRTAFDLLKEDKTGPDKTTMFHGGTMSGYMELKMAKLRGQYEAEALRQGNEARSDLFRGISILVNGLTHPNAGELKSIMMEHGGRLENYLVRGHVTHVIAENLPDTKIKQMSNEKDPIPILRPSWIVDSLAQGRLLPIEPYRLVPVKGSVQGQQKLFSFGRQGKDLLHPINSSTDLAGRPLASHFTSPRKLPVSGQQLGIISPGTMEHAQRTAASLRASCEVLSLPAKSSSETSAEAFVGTFFKASRLHFIGTWKTRIEELLASGDLEVGPAASLNAKERRIIHVDMDCFFSSAISSQYPELQGWPMCVSHSTSDKGTGEVSIASYARLTSILLLDRDSKSSHLVKR